MLATIGSIIGILSAGAGIYSALTSTPHDADEQKKENRRLEVYGTNKAASQVYAKGVVNYLGELAATSPWYSVSQGDRIERQLTRHQGRKQRDIQAMAPRANEQIFADYPNYTPKP